MSESILKAVSEYYGERVTSTDDLQTNACCADGAPPEYLKPILAKIHAEVHAKFYGCGSPIPPALEGARVLDLGCGTGRDCVVMATLVGDSGEVIGVDMTDEQLEVADRWKSYHEEKLGIPEGVLSFRKGHIEKLGELDIADNSIDVITSNCVLNLSPDKETLFSEIFRVLKPGGELYFSDVFADRRIPLALQEDPVLRGECLGGAMYTEDFRRLLLTEKCPDYRTISSAPIALENPQVEEKIGMVHFTSDTIRAFKLASLEDRCEDFGQVATYKEAMIGHPHRFELDNHHLFELGRPMRVCGNTAAMLEETRYARFFTVTGDRSQHFGLFPCDDDTEVKAVTSSGSCC